GARRELEVHTRLEVGSAQDEARLLRQIEQPGRAEQLLVLGREQIGRGERGGEKPRPVPRIEPPPEERAIADVPPAEAPEASLEELLEVGEHPARRGQAPPHRGEEPAGNRTTGDRGDGAYPGEHPELVQPPNCSGVEQRGPEATARQTEGDALALGARPVP